MFYSGNAIFIGCLCSTKGTTISLDSMLRLEVGLRELQSVTQIIPMALNLVTPKVGAEHELLFNKRASGSNNNGSFIRESYFALVRAFLGKEK